MFEVTVAFRFLREGKVQTVLILVGISVGIAVQIFLSALIGGLQKDLVRKTVGASPHITGSMPDRVPGRLLPDSIPAAAAIASSDGLTKPIRDWMALTHQLESLRWFTVVSPVVDGPGFALRGDKSLPVLIRGMILSKADSIYTIESRITTGEKTLDAGSVFIGTELAKVLRIKPGNTLRLAAAKGSNDIFTVRGIFDLESKPVNESWVIMPLSRAQTFLDVRQGITAIEIQIPSVFEALTISRRLAGSFGQVQWVSWQENNANLLAALRSQSSSSNLIQVLVLLAVTLGISSVLAVSAIQKAKQIGILKAIGATNRAISRIFLIMGGVLGFIGSIGGCFAGYALISLFLKATAASTGRPLFPLSIEPSLYMISILIATVAGTCAALIPARRSARLNPIEVIRNG